MEVIIPVGYKHSEVGVIPEDWGVKKLQSIVKGGRLPSGIYKDKNLYGQGCKIIKLGDVFNNPVFIPEKARKVRLSKEEIAGYRVKIGDIFIALASVKLEGVGKVMLVSSLDEETVYDHNVALIRLLTEYESKYVCELLKSTFVRGLIASRATQVGTTFLKASTILAFPLPLPAIKAEQTAIANALSNADLWIQSLNRILVKKRQIKKGAMQRLLTGKWRLSEFVKSDEYKNTELGLIPEDWEVKSISSFSELLSSKRIFEHDYVSSGIPFYRGTEISMLIDEVKFDCKYFITKKKFESIRSQFGSPTKNDILITAVGTLANIYLVDTEQSFYFKDGNLIWLRNIKNIDENYLSLQLKFHRKAILDNSIGSSQKALTIESLKNILIPIPPTKAEQVEIATVISSMDKEITQLETKIAKAKILKQGMMQNLLTGKIRLVKPQENADAVS